MAQRHATPYDVTAGQPIVRHRYVGGPHRGRHEAPHTRTRPQLGVAAWALCSVPTAWLVLLIATGPVIPARPAYIGPPIVASGTPPGQPVEAVPGPARDATPPDPAPMPNQPADPNPQPAVPPPGQQAVPPQPMATPGDPGVTTPPCPPPTPGPPPAGGQAPMTVIPQAKVPALPALPVSPPQKRGQSRAKNPRP